MMRWMIVALLLILLFGVAPLLSALGAGVVAAALGCALDEGSVHPCMVLGVDIGETLYVFGVLGWFMMITIPLAGIALAVWLITAAAMLILRWRRRPS